MGAADTFVEGPGVVLINKGQQTREKEQVDELGVQDVPLLYSRRAEDEQQHDDGAGDEGVTGKEPEQDQEADDEFGEGQGIGEGGDEGFRYDGALELRDHAVAELVELRKADEAVSEEARADAEAKE